MKEAFRWLWRDTLSWRSPHPFLSGLLSGLVVGAILLLVMVLSWVIQ